MSKSNDFVEREDAEFATQIKTFADGLDSTTAPNGATVGMTSGEITEAKNDAAYVKYVQEQQDKAKGFSQSYTKYKNDLRKGSDVAIVEPVFNVPGTVPTAVTAGVEDRFRAKVAKVKKSGSYTRGIGEAWHIEAPEVTVEIEVPEFSIEFVTGHPVIKWKKKNSDGIEIWKERGDGKGFVHVGNDTKSPWIDKDDLPPTGQSAVWSYKIVYLINDEQVGGFSAVVTVTVSSDVTGGRGVVN
jgi:hypothetical protein